MTTVQAELELEIVMDAEPQTLWRVLVDWERQGEWMPCTRVWQVDGPRLGIGTRVAARTGIGPVGFLDTMTVTHVDAPHRYEVVHTGGVVKGVGAFVVEPYGEKTRFRWWERVEVPGGPFARALWWVGGPVSSLTFQWALRRLRRLVEAEPEPASASASASASPPAS